MTQIIIGKGETTWNRYGNTVYVLQATKKHKPGDIVGRSPSEEEIKTSANLILTIKVEGDSLMDVAHATDVAAGCISAAGGRKMVELSKDVT